MEPRKTFTQTELNVIAWYNIPVEEVVDIEHFECRYVGGGATYIVTMRDGEKGWMGCGHLRCEQCKYSSAQGPVGDAAKRKYSIPAKEKVMEIREIRERAILNIVRAWGIPWVIKTQLLDIVLDGSEHEILTASVTRDRIQMAMGELESAHIEFGVRILRRNSK